MQNSDPPLSSCSIRTETISPLGIVLQRHLQRPLAVGQKLLVTRRTTGPRIACVARLLKDKGIIRVDCACCFNIFRPDGPLASFHDKVTKEGPRQSNGQHQYAQDAGKLPTDLRNHHIAQRCLRRNGQRQRWEWEALRAFFHVAAYHLPVLKHCAPASTTIHPDGERIAHKALLI
ncbi:hypothetical protein CBM2615_B140122 [Cupriavidus taiwanensis]|uniref:Uncharacterized protein n=1 Tax=Cupriavidus taiwanensis TaxID=164546 RepID=A0A976G3U3_9BURK|nr:hypothetical protein CBM2615_B140122 [Cupriavidus taiwanensis]SOZ67984.1 hypothetical protein CBM2613_B110122 [Cupriavidus taiwanensis]SPA07847.1 hypothetical protein CBM2625_B110122 [Cupriavidus taiwanensis]